MMCRIWNNLLCASASLLLVAASATAQPLDTTFTYQGELRTSGSPATGMHDLRFRLYDAPAGGSQVGLTLCADDVAVTEGRFTVFLDFGAQFSGQQRFLEVEVRADTGLGCGDPTGFVVLSPRQALTASPNAVFSLNAASATTAASAATATNATQLNGQPGSFYLDAANLNAGTVPDGRLASTVARTNTSQTFTGAMTFSNAGNAFTGGFSGSGAALTALNASGIGSGTLADARLTANVVLLHTNQTFTGGKAFSTAPAFTAAGAPFTVTSTTPVTNLNADLLDGLHASAFLQSIPVPLTLSGTSPTSHVIGGTNDATTGNSYGVSGRSTATTGLTWGVFGRTDSTGGAGVGGYAASATGSTVGVWGMTSSPDGRGVYGDAGGLSGATTGVWGRSFSTSGRGVFGGAMAASGVTYGGRFESSSTSGFGVFGLASAVSGDTFGLWGQSNSTSGFGIFGEQTATSGTTHGVYGRSASTAGRGVFGYASATSGTTYGGYFQNQSTGGVGAFGYATATTGTTYGLLGQSDGTSGRGVYGSATAASGGTYGGYFESASTSGVGVYGRATAVSGTVYGVRGFASIAAGGYAVYALGDMGASGVKPFRIDHPLDPENKYLLHYSTESPEVLNAYSGNVMLDGAGEAVVELPHYFASINKDPRYTLTAVGAPMPMLHVAEKISAEALADGERAGPGNVAPACSFRIAGGAPGGEVCWRVESVRNDLRMRLHGAPVETDKIGPERGTYQHPELYGQPPERGTNHHSGADASRPTGHDN